MCSTRPSVRLSVCLSETLLEFKGVRGADVQQKNEVRPHVLRPLY